MLFRSGGEGEEEACPLETPIYIQRRENHSYKEYAVQHTLVSNVFVSYAKISGKEIEKLRRDFLWGGANGGKKHT